jgi:predicted GH43/DUF377 family glycosyl hydrolase
MDKKPDGGRVKYFNLERWPSNEKPQPILIPRKDVEWEATAVFNPCVVRENADADNQTNTDAGTQVFHMLYRTYPVQTKPLSPKLVRPGFHLDKPCSYIGYARSADGIHFERRAKPFISPDQPYDRYGCEDPRITKIGDTFYITYTAIDSPLEDKSHKPNVRIALATTRDFLTITKHGIVGPPTTSKAAAFFPERVMLGQGAVHKNSLNRLNRVDSDDNGDDNGGKNSTGKIAFIMTISSDSANSHVAVRYYDSIEAVLAQTEESWAEFLAHSQETAVLGTYWWLMRGPELGAPPIKTDRGWLYIYSAEATAHVWTITAALADIDEPHKLIARAPAFLLEPVADYERNGLVPQVTFPSGAVIVEGDIGATSSSEKNLYVYYGAADTVIGLATCKLNALLDYLEGFKSKV